MECPGSGWKQLAKSRFDELSNRYRGNCSAKFVQKMCRFSEELEPKRM